MPLLPAERDSGASERFAECLRPVSRFIGHRAWYVGVMPDVPPLPVSFDRSALEYVGSAGWHSWEQLRANDLLGVPDAPAVYVVFRASTNDPLFRAANPGGRFKGKDPSVTGATLAVKWVADCQVVYIGKADQARRRLAQFARFGAGEPIGHWGGRYIWQLEDSAGLLVAWHVVSWPETARGYEKRLLAHFSRLHGGARPFANLAG